MNDGVIREGRAFSQKINHFLMGLGTQAEGRPLLTEPHCSGPRGMAAAPRGPGLLTSCPTSASQNRFLQKDGDSCLKEGRSRRVHGSSSGQETENPDFPEASLSLVTGEALS